eukprot:761583-Hanusia_phi.AAC.9
MLHERGAWGARQSAGFLPLPCLDSGAGSFWNKVTWFVKNIHLFREVKNAPAKGHHKDKHPQTISEDERRANVAPPSSEMPREIAHGIWFLLPVLIAVEFLLQPDRSNLRRAPPLYQPCVLVSCSHSR